MFDDASRPVARHGGLTLVEVVLVLALLVVIGAVSVPLVVGSFSRAGLHSASDLLRGAWSQARLEAMQSGQSYVFRFEPRGGRFQLVGLDQLGMPESQAMQPDDPEAEHAASDILRLARSRLPDGVIFARGDVADSPQLLATMGSTDDASWSSPILFRSDGTTSDASVLLANEYNQTIRVTLRGLTGISTASDVGSEAWQ